MSQREILDAERKALRDELHNLKNCQITFLTSSVTATGVLLGVAFTLSSKPDLGFVFIFPLVISLPSWWIFFDKATTITRIVGYYRIIEKLLTRPYEWEAKNFIGWENTLKEYRSLETRGEIKTSYECISKSTFKQWLKIFSLRMSHRYWVISYYIFLLLTSLCQITSAVILRNGWAVLFPALLFLVSAIWNARIVRHLIYGRYSYDCNEKIFEQILQLRKKHSVTTAYNTSKKVKVKR